VGKKIPGCHKYATSCKRCGFGELDVCAAAEHALLKGSGQPAYAGYYTSSRDRPSGAIKSRSALMFEISSKLLLRKLFKFANAQLAY
jgi:hypothetical protein